MGKHLHIRDFNGDLHSVLMARAKTKGLSLSEFLRQELSALASRPTVDEILQRIEQHPRPNISKDVLSRAFEAARAEREDQSGYVPGFGEQQKPLEK